MHPNPNHTIYADTIRRLYVESNMTLRQISQILHEDYRVGIGKNEIRAILLSRGVDTSRPGLGGHRTCTCACCGTQFQRQRSRHRHSIGRGPSAHRPWRTFCDSLCRRVWLEEHCAGQQEARRLVEDHLGRGLPDDAVCHFINDDTRDVYKRNIRVFTSTQRHVEEHRNVQKED